MTATPAKLRDGTWGARVQGPVSQGDVVTVTTKAGKTWQAKVTRVVWTDGAVAVCATASMDRPEGSSRGFRQRASNGECQCGACEDLLSFGYRPGQRIRCPECGGWAEAY